MNAAADRVQSIQILRGVAALLVVCNHAIVVQANFPEAMTGPFFPAMPALRNAGAMGVDLFFVISGFVMAHSIAASHRAQTATEFLRNRAIRILPLFWLLSAIFAFRQWSLGISLPAVSLANNLTLLPLFDGTLYHLPVLVVG